MNKLLRSLCAILIGLTACQVKAAKNLYIKIPKGIKYDFDVRFNFTNGDSTSLVLKQEGDEPVFICNLEDLNFNSFYFGTTAKFKAYIYKGILTNAKKHLETNKAETKDLVITIENVGGFLTQKWKSKSEWKSGIALSSQMPAVLFNSTDWHLEVNYTLQEDQATRHVTMYLNKEDKTKANFVQFGDINTMTNLKLQGKWSDQKTWTSLLTSGLQLNSTSLDLSKEVTAAIKKLDPTKETLSITVKHVAQLYGLSKLAGRPWDVQLKAIKYDDDFKTVASGLAVKLLPHGGRIKEK